MRRIRQTTTDFSLIQGLMTVLIRRRELYYYSHMQSLTAVYKKSGKWYLGWVEEIPGVNTQGVTLKETKENLKEALVLVLETNRELSRKITKGKVRREAITIAE